MYYNLTYAYMVVFGNMNKEKLWYRKIFSLQTSEKMKNDAVIFAETLGEKVMKPYISADEDGEISFWWDKPNISLEICLQGNGTYDYYANINKKEYMEGDLNLDIPLPSTILQELQIVL